MRTTSMTCGAGYATPLRNEFASAFARFLVRFVRAMASEHRIRRDTRELLGMSDYMLKDIGLTRSQIGYAVRFGQLG